jgi:quinol monooxygenase YgiN
MPLIRTNAPYITMINYFRVNPRDQKDLMQVQMEDLDLFGKKQPAMRAASFQQSTDGTRVINYAHWADMEGLATWRASDDMKAHMERMKPFDFKVDPHPYQVVKLSAVAAAPRIAPNDGLFPTLAMFETEQTVQQDVVDALSKLIDEWDQNAPAGHYASWIAQSRDGVRVALYSQWTSADAREQFVGNGTEAVFGDGIVKTGAKAEVRGFDVGRTGYKFEEDAG